jgi:hypothetical protein
MTTLILNIIVAFNFQWSIYHEILIRDKYTMINKIEHGLVINWKHKLLGCHYGKDFYATHILKNIVSRV